MNKNLEKLAIHLESGKLIHEVFDIHNWNTQKDGKEPNGCGYAGCAIGECPFLFPNSFEFRGRQIVFINEDKEKYDSGMEMNKFKKEVSDFFGIHWRTFDSLFFRDG